MAQEPQTQPGLPNSSRVPVHEDQMTETILLDQRHFWFERAGAAEIADIFIELTPWQEGNLTDLQKSPIKVCVENYVTPVRAESVHS